MIAAGHGRCRAGTAHATLHAPARPPERPTPASQAPRPLSCIARNSAQRAVSADPAAPRPPASFARGLAPGRFAVESDAASAQLIDAAERRRDRRGSRQRIDADAAARRRSTAASRDPSVARHMLLAFGAWLGDAALLERTGLARRPAAGGDPRRWRRGRSPRPAASTRPTWWPTRSRAPASRSARWARRSTSAAPRAACSRVLAAAFRRRPLDRLRPQRRRGRLGRSDASRRSTGSRAPTSRRSRSPTAQLDLVYAISIWSHFEPRFGLRWFEEMRRVLAPGRPPGVHDARLDGARLRRRSTRGGRSTECVEIERALYRDGHWFIDPFGEDGDWGVVNPLWGSAFVTPEFVAGATVPVLARCRVRARPQPATTRTSTCSRAPDRRAATVTGVTTTTAPSTAGELRGRPALLPAVVDRAASARPSSSPTAATTRSRSGRCTRSARSTYDVLQAVDDVSVEIAAGEFFGIVGRNGSGKSTLLKCLAGIYDIDARRAARARPAVAVHRARRRLQPGPDRARQRDDQRDHARPHAQARRASASTPSSPSPSSRTSSTCG